MSEPLDKFDPVLLSQVRLGIISVLMTRAEVSFQDLRTLLGLTQGNLGSHLQSLETSEYIAVEKAFVERKPRTTVRITPAGRQAFLTHVERLHRIARARSGDGGGNDS